MAWPIQEISSVYTELLVWMKLAEISGQQNAAKAVLMSSADLSCRAFHLSCLT